MQELKRYDSDGPQIDINDESDQKFVWMAAINQKGGDKFYLRPYDQDYYLKCMLITYATTGQTIVAKGGSNDETNFFIA